MAEQPALATMLLEATPPTDLVLNPETIAFLKAALSSASLKEAGQACRAVAELAKNPDNRGPLGEAGLVAACCAVMDRASETSDIVSIGQSARAIGNLCFDHNENRQQVLKCGGAAILSRAMVVPSGGSAAADTQLQHLAGAGAVLNVANDNEELVAALVEAGAVESLLWLLAHAPGSARMAVMALGRFIGNSDALARLMTGKGAALLVQQGVCEGAAPLETMEILRAAVAVDTLLPSLASDGALDMLVDIAAGPDLPLESEEDEDESQGAALLGKAQQVRSIASMAATVVAAALADDACVAHLQPREPTLIALFISWTAVAGWDRACAGAMALGNLARADDRCARLLAAGAAEALTAMLARDSSPTQHAALGALRNLAVARVGKPRILAALGPDAALAALQAGLVGIAYHTAALLRSILSGATAGAEQHVLTADVLARLAALRTSEEPRVAAEAGRALAAAVRSGSDTTLHLAVAAGALPSLTAMLNHEHVILRNEAAIALVRCCSVPPLRPALAAAGAVERVAHQLGAAQYAPADPAPPEDPASAGTDAGVLTGGVGGVTPASTPATKALLDGPPELICTMLALAAALMAEPEIRESAAGLAVKERVARLAEHEHGMVRSQASAVLGMLRPQ